MHRLSMIDVWILLGIYHAEPHSSGYYAEIISALPDLGKPLPTHDEFASAYNKFLYLSFIVADGEITRVSAVAKQLIESRKNSISTSDNDREWVDNIYQLLSTYKLKSMCNRHVWTECQYVAAIITKRD